MTSRDGSAPLPRQVQDVLPAEPDALAVISAQISSLALERAGELHQKQTEALQSALSTRDAQATELQARCDDLLADHVALTDDLAAAHESIARLEGEKAALADSVRTLAERVQKLEAFKRTLIASLQDESGGMIGSGSGGGSGGGGHGSSNGGLWPESAQKAPPEGDRLVREILAGAKPANLPKHPSLAHAEATRRRSGYSNTGSHTGYSTPATNGVRTMPFSAAHGDHLTSPMSHVPPQHPLNQPHLMHDHPPAQQQPQFAGSGGGNRGTPMSAHGVGQGNENSMAAGNTSVGGSRNGAAGREAGEGGHSGGDATAAAHPPRVDGKDFFKQARTRLPYESFAAFLQNIKDLNTGKQTREATLERARDIFGASNGDLFVSFQGLLARHLSSV